jgi:hypothetical protein
VGADDRPRDGKAEAGSTGFPASGRLKPSKRLEGVLLKLFRDSRTIIVDPNQDALLVIVQRHASLTAILDGVIDEVAQGAAQGGGPTTKGHRSITDVQCDGMAGVRHVVADALE